MPRGKAISEDMRKSIIISHNDGLSAYKISQNLKISRSSVRNIINLYKNTGQFKI